jgi:hypothetical protein
VFSTAAARAITAQSAARGKASCSTTAPADACGGPAQCRPYAHARARVLLLRVSG